MPEMATLISGVGIAGRHLALRSRLEQRDPHVAIRILVVLEDHLHRHPDPHSSGGQLTMLVVSRRPACSSIST